MRKDLSSTVLSRKGTFIAYETPAPTWDGEAIKYHADLIIEITDKSYEIYQKYYMSSLVDVDTRRQFIDDRIDDLIKEAKNADR